MVNKTYTIQSFGLDQETRYLVIDKWINKIKPQKKISPFITLPVFIFAYLFGLLGGLVAAAMIFIYIKSKPAEGPEIIEKTNPHYLKLEIGISEASRPTAIVINNNPDEIELDFSMFGTQLGAKKVLERWDFLVEQLEKIIQKESSPELT